jgi:putative YphP/YqiW family bacilliredoxin
MQFTFSQQPTYDPAAVQPMRDELVTVGFEEIIIPQDVDEVLKNSADETILVMINSVCGCAAGSARPGVTLALQNKIIPDRLVTIFAGQEKEAVAHLRTNYLKDFTPSSPFIALMKNGEVLYTLQRFEIEGRSHKEIAYRLTEEFNRQCTKQGPSISPEDYDKLVSAVACGSKIPRFSAN